MKKISAILILIFISLSLYGQALRPIRTDTIQANVPGGSIDIQANISINSGVVEIGEILDEDDMVSDSATALATQQSIKYYVDEQVATLGGIGDVIITGPTTNDLLVWNGAAWVDQDTVQLSEIGIGGTVDASSVFDITSTTQGSRPCPAMTEAERDLIAAPAQGLCIFNTTSNVQNIYDGSSWTVSSGLSTVITAPAVSDILTFDGSDWVNLGVSQITKLYENFNSNTDYVTKYGVGSSTYNAFGTMAQTVPPLLPDYPTGDAIEAFDLDIGTVWQIELVVQFKDLGVATQEVLVGGSATMNTGRDFLVAYIPSTEILYIGGGTGEAGYSIIQSIAGDIQPGVFNTIRINRSGTNYTIVVNGSSVYNPTATNTAAHVVRYIGYADNVLPSDFDGYVESYDISSVTNPSNSRSGVYSLLATVPQGSVYYNTTCNTVREFRGSSWFDRFPVVEWSQSTQYPKGAVVWSINAFYVSKVCHTSGSGTIQDDIDNWNEIAFRQIINGNSNIEIASANGEATVTTNGVLAATFDTNQDLDLVGDLSLGDSIQMTPATGIAHSEGLFFYDDTNKTITLYNDESEVAHQLGQEMFIRVYNNTGSTITNGSVVYISGVNGTTPEITLAQANSASSLAIIGIATHDIENTTYGYITTSGTVRDVDTSGYTAGDVVWLSDTVAGDYTGTMPDSPNYNIRLGTVGVVNATTGTLDVNVQAGSNTSGVIKIFNGAILENHNVTVSSDGATVTLYLEKDGGGDLSLFFNGIFNFFDTSPAASVVLTAGTDTVPTLNYVYIPESTLTLTASTAGFPAAQHVPVATVLVQSAASLQTDDAYKVHAWTDHLSDGNDQGHLSHLNKWIRAQHATWLSGMGTTPTISTNVGTPDNVDVAIASGTALQLHEHATPAYDTSTGSEVYVVNDFTTPYTKVTDLNTLLTDALGNSMSGRRFSLVFWQVINEVTSESKLMVNLPICDYGTDSAAINDSNGCSVYTFPADFKGTAVLLSRLTFQHQVISGGTWTLVNNEDLRGLIPSIVAGGVTAGAKNEYEDSLFSIFNNTDNTKVATFDASSITTATTRSYIFPDADGTFLLGTGTDNFVPLFNGSNAVDVSLVDETELSLLNGRTYIPDAAGASGQVAYFSATNTLTSGTGLTYDGTDLSVTAGIEAGTVGVGGSVDTSSILDTVSTTKGTRPCPSMTEAQRDLIGTPATGLCVYNTDDDELNIYTGAAWEAVGSGGSASSIVNGTSNITIASANGAAVATIAGNAHTAFETDGTLSVDTADYETLVTDDDDVPNKLYADQQIERSSLLNYILNFGAEYDDTGYNTYDDGAVSKPVDGTGGSPAISFTRSASSPLYGVGKMLLTNTGADRQGEGGSYDFTIEDGATYSPITVSFTYDISGTFDDDYVVVYVYDKDNTELITTLTTNDLPNTSTKGKFVASFTATDADDYRIIWHVATTDTDVWTLAIDNIRVKESEPVEGVILEEFPVYDITGYISSTDTGYSENTCTATPYSTVDEDGNEKWFIKGNLSLEATSISGWSVTWTGLNFTNTGGTLGRQAISVNTNSNSIVGEAMYVSGTTMGGGFSGNVDYYDVQFNVQIDAKPTWATKTYSRTFVGNILDNTPQSIYVNNSGETLTANTTDIPFLTKVTDNNAAWDGDSYTIPSDGKYTVSGNLVSSTSVTPTFNLYVGGTIDLSAGSTRTSATNHEFHVEQYFNRGDVVSIRSSVGFTLSTSATSNWISISKLPSYSNQSSSAPAVGYIDVDATYFTTGVSATTSYKAQNLESISGDTYFMSIATDQLTLKKGKYALEVPVYAYNNSQFLDFALYSITDTAIEQEFQRVSYSAVGARSGITVQFTLELSATEVFEFRTKSSNAAGTEFMGRIKITKLR